MIVPTLETERLVLRPMRGDDLPAYAALMASPRAAYMGGPHDELGAWRMFCQDIALWAIYGHGGLMIDLKSDSTTIGQVGINHGPLFPEKELGWFLYDGFEGQGYATEAAAAIKHWAFQTLRLDTLVSYVDKNNLASAAVAKRLGGVEDDLAVREDPVDLVFRYSRT
jgi:RimJ/RimL family protein N-acetyltransferase